MLGRDRPPVRASGATDPRPERHLAAKLTEVTLQEHRGRDHASDRRKPLVAAFASEFTQSLPELSRRTGEIRQVLEATIVKLDFGFELALPGALNVARETNALGVNIFQTLRRD